MSTRGKQRGRGGQRGSAVVQRQKQADPVEPDSVADEPETGRGLEPKQAASNDKTETKADAHDGVCLLCYDQMKHAVVTSCGHSNSICGECVLRMRLFLKRKKDEKSGEEIPFKWECPFCKATWEKVVYSRDVNKTLRELESKELRYDNEIDVYFENSFDMQYYLKMRALFCPLCEKSGKSSKWFKEMVHLSRHLETVHKRYFCQACTTVRSLFVQERTTYTRSDLVTHFKKGSPPTATEGPINPHPFCKFCNTPYFSNDELYAHLTGQHASCRFCRYADRQKYFRDNRELLAHFRNHHFVCDHEPCRSKDDLKDLAVFDNVVDLKAHVVAVHVDKSKLSRSQLQKLSSVDLDFSRIGLVQDNPDNIQEFTNEELIYRPEPSLNENSQPGRLRARPQEFPRLPSQRQQPERALTLADRARLANQQVSAKAARASRNHKRAAPSAGIDEAVIIPPDTEKPENDPSTPVLPPGAGPAPRVGASALVTEYPPRSRAATASLDEFPVLGGAAAGRSSLSGPAAPYRAAASGVPRGEDFPSLPTAIRPASMSQTLARSVAPGKVVQKKKKKKPTSVISAAVDPRSLEHVPLPLPEPCPPEESATRNKGLIESIRGGLFNNDEDKFAEFKSISGQYRKSSLSAAEYYEQFSKLIGEQADASAVEKVFMDLISLLPDEDKRKELHAEYAKRKVWAKLSKIVQNDKRKKQARGSAAAPRSRASVTIVKAHGQSGVGITPFESFAVRELKKQDEPLFRQESQDDDEEYQEVDGDEGDEDEEELEEGDSEPEAQEIPDVSDPTPPPKQKAATLTKQQRKKLAGKLDDSDNDDAQDERMESDDEEKAIDSTAPNFSRLVATSLSHPDLKQKPSSLPRQSSKPTSSAGVPAAGVGKASPLPNFGDAQDFPEPQQALERKSSEPASAPKPKPVKRVIDADNVPDPGALDLMLEIIAQLSIPKKPLDDVNFLSSLLLACFSTLSDRVGDIRSLKAAVHWIGSVKRQQIADVVSRVRLADVLIFGRLGQLGLALNAVQLLSGVVGMHQRYGAGGDGSDVIQDWTEQAFASMTPKELFLVYEYLHALLSYLTSGAHPEMSELQKTQRNLSQRQKGFTHKDGVLVLELNKSKKAHEGIESFFGKPGKDDDLYANPKADPKLGEFKSSNNKGKAKTKPTLLFRQGI